MNILTIDHKTFYELRVKGLVEASTPGNRIYERGEKPSCFVYFTTPNDDEPPFELLEIIGKATDPNKILTKEVFVKYIAGAFFSHQPLFVAFDDKDSLRFQVAAVLPTLKPIADNPNLPESIISETDPKTTAESIAKKLITYSLNENHPVGKDKARVFKSALGITRDNAQDLVDLIVLDFDKATKEEISESNLRYGQKYKIITTVVMDGKPVEIISVWVYKTDGVLRLVTTYIEGKKGKNERRKER